MTWVQFFDRHSDGTFFAVFMAIVGVSIVGAIFADSVRYWFRK